MPTFEGYPASTCSPMVRDFFSGEFRLEFGAGNSCVSAAANFSPPPPPSWPALPDPPPEPPPEPLPNPRLAWDSPASAKADSPFAWGTAGVEGPRGCVDATSARAASAGGWEPCRGAGAQAPGAGLSGMATGAGNAGAEAGTAGSALVGRIGAATPTATTRSGASSTETAADSRPSLGSGTGPDARAAAIGILSGTGTVFGAATVFAAPPVE